MFLQNLGKEHTVYLLLATDTKARIMKRWEDFGIRRHKQKLLLLLDSLELTAIKVYM